MQTDWGVYGYSWRAFGLNFKVFLSGIGGDYLINKLSTNLNYMILNGGDRVFGRKQDNFKAVAIRALFEELQKKLKIEMSPLIKLQALQLKSGDKIVIGYPEHIEDGVVTSYKESIGTILFNAVESWSESEPNTITLDPRDSDCPYYSCQIVSKDLQLPVLLNKVETQK